MAKARNHHCATFLMLILKFNEEGTQKHLFSCHTIFFVMYQWIDYMYLNLKASESILFKLALNLKAESYPLHFHQVIFSKFYLETEI
jgi:hypothetical protein